MLVLFDIDGTLLRSQGIGVRSMEYALQELHGVPVNATSIDMGGSLDPHVFRELSEQHELPVHEEALHAFRDAYVARMAHAFEMQSWAEALPGAIELVRAIHEHPATTGAILTGNLEPTSWMKLLDAGFDREWFSFGVFGDEADTRPELPSIARTRHHDRSGQLLDHSRIVVIGDTPRDVECAHSAGCVAVAVATGKVPVKVLHEVGADLVLESLSDTKFLIDWISSR